MSEEEQLALLATDGMLVKRPILVGEDSSAPASARRSGRRHWDDPAVRLRPAGWYHQGGVPAGVPPVVRRGGPVFHPVFSPTDQHILTKRDQRELDPAANAGLPVVPQVMTRRAPDFLWAAEIVADMGYTEVNLNLGCPSGTVTAKGKGAGFLQSRRSWSGSLTRYSPP